jgi:transcriptional regulator GlxA family with amidase domain
MIDVFFVLLPGSLILDWAGPAEALRMANQLLQAQGGAPRFRLRFAGPKPQAATSVWIEVTGLEPLPARLPDPSWVVLVGMPGHAFDAGSGDARRTVQWLAGQQPGREGLSLVTVCAGALLAAHAGLLHGRRATTHHHHLDELRRAATWCPTACS